MSLLKWSVSVTWEVSDAYLIIFIFIDRLIDLNSFDEKYNLI